MRRGNFASRVKGSCPDEVALKHCWLIDFGIAAIRKVKSSSISHQYTVEVGVPASTATQAPGSRLGCCHGRHNRHWTASEKHWSRSLTLFRPSNCPAKFTSTSPKLHPIRGLLPVFAAPAIQPFPSLLTTEYSAISDIKARDYQYSCITFDSLADFVARHQRCTQLTLILRSPPEINLLSPCQHGGPREPYH